MIPFGLNRQMSERKPNIECPESSLATPYTGIKQRNKDYGRSVPNNLDSYMGTVYSFLWFGLITTRPNDSVHYIRQQHYLIFFYLWKVKYGTSVLNVRCAIPISSSVTRRGSRILSKVRGATSESKSCRPSEAGPGSFWSLMLKYAFSYILGALFPSFLTGSSTPKTNINSTLHWTSNNFPNILMLLHALKFAFCSYLHPKNYVYDCLI